MSTKYLTICLRLVIVGIASVSIGQDIVYKEDPDAAKRMMLLLKDFEPYPMVHLPVHEVPHAKFSMVDIHNHVNDPQGINGESAPQFRGISTARDGG